MASLVRNSACMRSLMLYVENQRAKFRRYSSSGGAGPVMRDRGESNGLQGCIGDLGGAGLQPCIATKHLDTAINTFMAAVHVAFTHADAVLMCNVGNSAVAWIPRLFGKPVVLNVDGLDRQRRKWGWLARTYLHFNEWLSTFTPTRLVTDARAIQDYYRQRYRRESAMIAYGAAVPAAQNPDG